MSEKEDKDKKKARTDDEEDDEEDEVESDEDEQQTTEVTSPTSPDSPPPPPAETAAEPSGGEEDEEEARVIAGMFPEGVGELEEGDEEEFQDKYGIGDILAELDNEDDGAGTQFPSGEDDYYNYEELIGEEGPDGPTVEQLEAMIKFFDEQKQPGGEEEEQGDKNEEEGDEGEEYAEGKTTIVQAPGDDATTDMSLARQKMLMVLGPDHPKMVRFQKALKEHLQRQIYLVETETRDIEQELKEKRKERTELGTAMFNLQNEMLRQTELMDKYEKDLTKMTDKRTKTETATQALKESLKKWKNDLELEENRERELVQSMKTLDYSEFVVRQAAEKYDGELKIRQFIDEKIEKMKEQSEKQKRDTDFYIDKVMTQIQHMEQINEGIQRQINAHLEEQKQMTTYINEAITEIEALQIEKIHLQRAWNETISVVKSRDDALSAARKAVAAMEEDYRIKESELRSLVRLITREQESQEQSLVLLRRRRVEEKILGRQLQVAILKNQRLRDKLSELHKIKQQVEFELVKLNSAYIKRRKDENGPRRQIEKLSLEKIRLEDQILLAIQERSAMDKAAEHILGKIKNARDRTRHLDSEVAKVENEMTQLTIDVEQLRGELLKKQAYVTELEKKLNKQEKVLQDQTKDIKQSERVIQKKSGEIDQLNKKVRKLVVQSQDGMDAGPLEQEMHSLRKQIKEEKLNVIQLQEDWLRRQDTLVQLTSQRDHVIQQNELLRKEVFIMERKRQRLENELEKKRNEIKKLTKATEVLRKEIRTVNHRLHKDKFDQEQMDKDNILIQNELSGLLKDSEMEALELEQEIDKLTNEKETLFVSLHEVHEQNLQWEKKVHLAKELKDNIKKEQESSLSGLKLAIHHMQVRFNELTRAQEKLMGDLERSIEHRDMIIQRADLSMKRANIQPTKTKLNVHRSLTQLQERNKYLMKEAKEVETEVKGLMDTITQIEERLNTDTTDLEGFKQMIHVSESKIQEAAVQKHKNLLEIILRQQKYKVLESVKLHRYKPMAKSVDDLHKMIEDYENKCLSLVDLSEKLIEDYPETTLHSKLVKASILANA